MSAHRIAARYAKSVINLAQEKGKLKEVNADMHLLADTIAENRDFKLMLKSPIINADKKEDILKAIFGSKLTDITTLFIELLVKKGREKYLAEVTKAAIDIYNKMHNITKATLTTAVPVDAKIANEVKALLKQVTNDGEVQIEEVIDEELIGGFVLQYGDKLIDNSVQRKLQIIKKEIQDTTYINKI